MVMIVLAIFITTKKNEKENKTFSGLHKYNEPEGGEGGASNIMF